MHVYRTSGERVNMYLHDHVYLYLYFLLLFEVCISKSD